MYLKQFSFLLLFLCLYIVNAIPVENENTDSLIETCECISHEVCPWAVDVLNLLSEGKLALFGVFQTNVCNRKTQKVWCCENKEGTSVTPSTPEQLKMLNDGLANASAPVGKESGRWKPRGEEEECGLKTTIETIVNGQIAKLGAFPYMALLGYDLGDGVIQYGCGGSLINKKYVLTAAHCFDDYDVAEVVLSELNTKTDPDCNRKGPGIKICFPKITRKVDKVIKHEDYKSLDSGARNDIALIRLSEPVTLFVEDPMNSGASPVCLPWKQEDPGRNVKDGDKAVVTGWGRTTNNRRVAFLQQELNKVGSTRLRYAKLPIATDECAESFNIDKKLHICAGGDDDVDSCSGDSGGPLVIREHSEEPWYQVGLVSFGTNKCGVGKPGVYTRTTAYLDWIDSKLED